MFRVLFIRLPGTVPRRYFARIAAGGVLKPVPTTVLLSPKVEDEYTRKTPVEHVLLRPGMYIGSPEECSRDVWVFDAATRRMVRRTLTFVPGLLKIFDEILVNACDAAQRDPVGMTRLDVWLTAGGDGKVENAESTSSISAPLCRVRNDGRGIPIVQHATERLYVHELVFGHLLTGSNFGGKERVATTGGQHGYGAKLANIFSTSFTVRAADASRKLAYEQTWSQNMAIVSKPMITPLTTTGIKDFTEVDFCPDIARFARGVHHGIDPGTLATMQRRVIDSAGTLSLASNPSSHVIVSLNNSNVPVSGWTEYVRLYTPPFMQKDIKSSSVKSVKKIASVNETSPPLTVTSRGRGKVVSTAIATATAYSPLANQNSTADGITAVAWPLPLLAIGVTSQGAASLLSSLQVATLSDRIQVGAGVAGLKINENGWNPPSGSGSSVTDFDATALEAYNTPGSFASFVNCMATPRGGSHVTLIIDALSRRLADYCTKRLKKVAIASAQVSFSSEENTSGGGGVASSSSALSSALAAAIVTPALVRAHLRIAVNVRLSAPAFDSQSKDALVTPIDAVLTDLMHSSVGSVALTTASARADAADALFTDVFVRSVAEEGGVLFAVVSTLMSKAATELSRSARRPSRVADSKVRGIPKLEDANWAGGRRAAECTLILTEGDSAKALAVAGLAEVGRDAFGVFPLRGKLLNVRDVQLRDALENAEVSSLMAILGLDLAKTYEDGTKGLRYGRVMIMADQDVDGSHIKGLIVNLFHTFWPKLLESGSDGKPPFLQQFVTPVIKARRGGVVRDFFSIRDFNTWRATADEAKRAGWITKYYKGLGTSTSAEGRAYFAAIIAHTRSFKWGGPSDGEAIRLAFSKDRADDRKDWLSHAASGLNDIARNARANAPQLTYANFVHDELVDFSLADLARSIPSVIDGLKPSQRKVLYACFKRGGGRGSAGTSAVAAAIRSGNTDTPTTSDLPSRDSEIKVAQLAGYVAEHTAYHHGEASLVSTIVSMAQDFVGSNNVPLLSPLGQFGTRLAGGKDAASARYIFTRVAPLARAFFPAADDDILRRAEDDGSPVEPVSFLPVIPFVLINGTAGIGTGWSTMIPSHHPLHVVRAVRAALDDDWLSETSKSLIKKDPFPLHPWWRGFNGNVEPIYNAASDGFPVSSLEGVNTVGCIAWDDSEEERSDKQRRNNNIMDHNQSGSGGGDYLDGLLLDDAGGSSPPNNAVSVRITELPVGRWTEAYKVFLHHLVAEGNARSVKEFHTESRAEFVITLTPAGIAGVLAAATTARGGSKTMRNSTLTNSAWHTGLISYFRLTNPISMRNMHLFDTSGRVMKFISAWDIIREWLPMRAEGYAARRLAIAAALSRAERRAAAQANFLSEIRAGRLELGRASKADLEATLASRGFPTMELADDENPHIITTTDSNVTPADAVAARYIDTERVGAWAREVASRSMNSTTSSINTSTTSPSPPVKGVYDYLLEIPLSRLTDESTKKSRTSAAALAAALEVATRIKPEEMWREDLTNLEKALHDEGFVL